ncbi:Death-inducer obliterator 1 [Danaus plexippus plexippus]|uniref:Death-inducer obliterator 1 n=1 Tax=Danaus plexippus plexippus TaxID=278856 RepID=A0A212F1Z9_DANPL|nr:Death-inducer obliterator 1 [Danaus plexippus plexippus]
MSNTVITNYTDLNGPSTKSDNSVVVIVNKDGSLSVDQNLLGTLMGTDGSQSAGISVVRVGHEGRPDDATDSENEDDKVPHVTLSVDSYYNEPASIIKYDSGAEMLQSLRIETRENSLVGFQNDHCYTPLTSPSQIIPQRNDSFAAYDDPVIEITNTPPPKPVATPKKITILEQQIIPKGKKIILNTSEPPIILKGNDILTKPLPVLMKSKLHESEKSSKSQLKTDENVESSSVSSSGDSTADRDSDSDYKDVKDKTGPLKQRKIKSKPRILKMVPPPRTAKIESKVPSRLRANKNLIKKDIKEKLLNKNLMLDKKMMEAEPVKNNQNYSLVVSVSPPTVTDISKVTPKSASKVVKKDKKTPAHMTALLTDMTSLFSTPDVIRRVSTENKVPSKVDKEPILLNKTLNDIAKPIKAIEGKILTKTTSTEEMKSITAQKPLLKQTKIPCTSKSYDPIPQLDDASLAQILQDTPQMIKAQPNISSHVINSPGLAGPLSPTLDLLGGLQPEEDGLTEDLLMHVAQLVESSENLQEVIDKQVLGKVDISAKAAVASPFNQSTSNDLYTPPPKAVKSLIQRKDPIEIVRRDGRVITLPPIEAPATRSSKRKTQVEQPMEPTQVLGSSTPTHPVSVTPEPLVQQVSKQYTNKKLVPKKQEQSIPMSVIDKMSAESQESWNSEDDPNRLWCICKQPHNNRFMICCDGCEDWFHGKCVNITKAMGQQMEDQGIEWRCPNCVKNAKASAKNTNKVPTGQKDNVGVSTPTAITKELPSKTTCIVCKKPARASSIYCSDACILKHAQDSLGSHSTAPNNDSTSGKNEKPNSESRVIVYERKSGRLLAGPNAPTAENLKAWLQKNPTFEVVRPGTLSAIKPNVTRKKSLNEPAKIQTTLNFARIPRKSSETPPLKSPSNEPKEKEKPIISPKEEVKPAAPPKTPTTPKSQPPTVETPKSSNKVPNEGRKAARATSSKTQPVVEKTPSVSPSTSRRKDTPDRRSRMSSEDPIRENVRKALQEQIASRMAEYDGPKFTEEEIQQFAYDTELELHELFNRDVGMKYKAKYRSLMFNIKDRKNLSLWEKICEKVITPKQLVRFSPEELASQELAQWRDKEAKHQLELIKKSEIDLLAASKTYVLKTHKGEEVMETKESVSTELDPNVPVEDIVTALNDGVEDETQQSNKKDESQKKHTKKKDKENRKSSRKKDKESRRNSEKGKSRSTRRKSDVQGKERRSSGRVRRRSRSSSKSKKESREESVSRERSRHRSRSRGKKRHSTDNSRSQSRGRDRSRSRSRRSRSRDSTKRRRRSRSKVRQNSDDKFKHRSKSQETMAKNKNDSTDSDSIERPKSAMMKETHPEYDPHEPMITSAFSEEDIRKSREDVYEERYNKDISDYSKDFDNEHKSFSIDTNIALSPTKYENQDKTSAEVESDQEPTSTVEHSAPTVWNGCINMVDVARFYVAAHEVSGNAVDLEDDLTPELDIVGRINPDTVWDYIAKMKRAGNKDIVLLKLQAANDEERMQYIALYSYLSSRNRLGVVKVTNTATVKDFYIVPLPANTSLPDVLLPLDGPGLGEVKTHLLISIIIRQRKKRLAPNIPKDIIPAKVDLCSYVHSRLGVVKVTNTATVKDFYIVPLPANTSLPDVLLPLDGPGLGEVKTHLLISIIIRQRKKRLAPNIPKDIIPAKVSRSRRGSRKRSYTPPLSPRRRPPFTSSLSTTVKDKIAASLAADEEPYSPGSASNSSSAPGPSLPPNTLRSKMEELNRQIEEQKQQILKMAQADSSADGENEAYSPSRPLTPPAPVVTLDEIALPSNLQEILATIKQRSETAADVDMRTLPMP